MFEGSLGELNSQGDLILGGASRLDAFSGYPFKHNFVFEGSLGELNSQGDLILGGASRLDAFSGYPFHT